MKLEALDHPKTLDFAARLGVELPTAIGYLELLWAFTGKKSPAGNIGKWPDGAIARACHFMGDPQSFLQSLLQSGFIDLHEAHRYVIHDWQEHCPRWVSAKLKKLNCTFSGNGATAERTAVATTVASVEPITRARAIPREDKTRQGKGIRTHAADQTAVGTPESDGTHGIWLQCRAEYPAGLWEGPKEILAERAIGRLLEQGESAEQLVAAAHSYREQQSALGKVGTEFVRGPEKFYGDGFWRGPFPLPQPSVPKSTAPTMDEMRAKYGTEASSG
jgi:hypothetical protein